VNYGPGVPPAASVSAVKGSERNGHAVIKVKPRGNESVQQLLRRFKRLCQREGLTRDIKRTSYYEKPSERRRRRSRKSLRKASEALV
jgi:small subunit ribosomal protein S21